MIKKKKKKSFEDLSLFTFSLNGFIVEWDLHLVSSKYLKKIEQQF